MDNIREKMVELIDESGACFNCFPCDGYEKEEKYKIADHLISHGVTMQEWIPVTERLPQDEKEVLAYYGFGGSERMFMGALSYFCFDPNPHWQHESTGLTVTHWMPLPTTPKGE